MFLVPSMSLGYTVHVPGPFNNVTGIHCTCSWSLQRHWDTLYMFLVPSTASLGYTVHVPGPFNNVTGIHCTCSWSLQQRHWDTLYMFLVPSTSLGYIVHVPGPFNSQLCLQFSLRTSQNSDSDLKPGSYWLPCQVPGVRGSVPGLVGPVSVYGDWMRQQV